MIYTKLTRKALRICFACHKDQLDKSGEPYVFHPFHVAEQMKDEDSTCVALLHDVIEDSDYTTKQLIEDGFSKEVVSAVEAITRRKDEKYMDYINRVKKNELATIVKLADLDHNTDINRLDEITDEDVKRRKKYFKAIELLKG